MKKLNLLLVFVCAGLLYADPLKNFSFNRSMRASSKMGPFDNPKYIAGPTVITQPGSYVLMQPIAFDPSGPGESAIVINSDNVLLDCNLRAIFQVNGNIQPDTNAIRIMQNCHNVIIRSGAIGPVTGIGILLDDGTHVIDIYDFTFANTEIAGIKCDGSATGTGINNIVFSNLAIQGVGGVSSDQVHGMWFKNVIVGHVEECVVTRGDTTNGTSSGLMFDGCRSMLVTGCIAGENSSAGENACGFWFNNTSSFIVLNSSAIQNELVTTNTTGIAAGFRLTNCSDFFLESCAGINTRGTYATYGFLLENSSACQFKKCDGLANTSSAASAYGFATYNGNLNTFENADASKNIGALDGIGFFLDSDEHGSGVVTSKSRSNIGYTGKACGVYFGATVNCMCVGTQLVGNWGETAGYGFFDMLVKGTPTSTVIANVAMKNSTANYNVTESPSFPLYTGDLHGTPGPYENVNM